MAREHVESGSGEAEPLVHGQIHHVHPGEVDPLVLQDGQHSIAVGPVFAGEGNVRRALCAALRANFIEQLGKALEVAAQRFLSPRAEVHLRTGTRVQRLEVHVRKELEKLEDPLRVFDGHGRSPVETFQTPVAGLLNLRANDSRLIQNNQRILRHVVQQRGGTRGRALQLRRIRREQGHAFQLRRRTLVVGTELAQRLDFVPEEFDSHRRTPIRWVHIHDPTAHAELSGALHQVLAHVAHVGQAFRQRIEVQLHPSDQVERLATHGGRHR